MVRVQQDSIENIEESMRLLLLLNSSEANYEPGQVTGQMLKTRDDEVRNSAGGYVFQVSDLTRVRRFLILGTSGGTYYSAEKELTLDNLEHLIKIIKAGKGGMIIREILEISLSGRAPKQEPTMFALALCARYDVKDRKSELMKKKSPAEKLTEGLSEEAEAEIRFNDYIVQLHKAAFHAMSKVCRIPTHLFMFVKFCEMVSGAFAPKSTGWSRMMRKAIGSWYLDKDAKSLAIHITKYPQREGWSHKDLLRLSHPEVSEKGEDALVYDQIFYYAIHGKSKNFVKETSVFIGETNPKKRTPEKSSDEPETKKPKQSYEVTPVVLEKEENSQALKFLNAAMKMKQLKETSQADECSQLIREFGLVREHVVNTELLNTTTVWIALLEKMPLTALIRNLSKLSTLGLISGTNTEYDGYVKKVISDITNEGSIKKARVHPLTILLALATYRSGHGLKGKLSWTPNAEIIDALEIAFLLAFQNVEPTGKRFCLAFDVSGSMTSHIMGTNLSCREASAALGMCVLKKEPKVECMAFSKGFVALPFTSDWKLTQMTDHVNRMPFSNTDCSLPMIWATKNKKEFDVFMVFTDSETYSGEMKPHEALVAYRKTMNIPDAKLVVVGMTSTDFTIADPTDPNMLDVVGFDSAVPELVRSFVMGQI